MEYNIQQLAKLAGISKRTLRYYDEIGLLCPKREEGNEYRVYGDAELAVLQQILYYRALDMRLEDIKQLVHAPTFDEMAALQGHLQALQEKKAYYESLIHHVEKTIAYKKGEYDMTNEEKFAAFKRTMIEENDAQYGKEVQERYGADAAAKSNAQLMKLTEQQYQKMNALSSKWHELVKEAMQINDPACDAAQEACLVHKEWLSLFWEQYSQEAHLGLAQMYVEDERFRLNFEQVAPGFASFFHEAIKVYCAK